MDFLKILSSKKVLSSKWASLKIYTEYNRLLLVHVLELQRKMNQIRFTE